MSQMFLKRFNGFTSLSKKRMGAFKDRVNIATADAPAPSRRQVISYANTVLSSIKPLRTIPSQMFSLRFSYGLYFSAKFLHKIITFFFYKPVVLVWGTGRGFRQFYQLPRLSGVIPVPWDPSAGLS